MCYQQEQLELDGLVTVASCNMECVSTELSVDKGFCVFSFCATV